MNFFNKFILLFFWVAFSTNVYAIPDLGKTGIVYINGMLNSEGEATISTRKTEKLLNLPKGTISYIYNPGGIEDLWEVYKQVRTEAAKDGDPATLFWLWLRSPSSAFPSWQKKYYEEVLSPPSTVNINAFKKELEVLRKNKTEGIVIVSHSQGNFVANAIIDEIIKDNQFVGEECMAMVSVATPTTRVSNNGKHHTFINDQVINAARIASATKNQKTLVGNLPATTLGGIRHHGYVDSYLADTSSSSSIVNDIDRQIDKLKVSCRQIQFGRPLFENGGYNSSPQNYYLDIPRNSKNDAQDIIFNFEAYHVPDGMVAIANGITLFSTGGAISGPVSQTVKFDPKLHGHRISIQVSTPNKGTSWRMCVSYVGAESHNQCQNLNLKKVNVSASIRDTFGPQYRCNYSNIMLNEFDILDRTVAITEGKHKLTWSGGCRCVFLGCSVPPPIPKVRINGLFIPDIRLNQRQPVFIDVRE